MKLVVVRHLPTLWNSKGLLQGKRNESILQVNDKTAKELKNSLLEILEEQLPDVVLTSSLVRTQQTARTLGYDKFLIDSHLDELDFGNYEGCKREEFLKSNKDQWNNRPASLTLGEPVTNLKLRINALLEDYGDKNLIICFGHGAWMRALYSSVNHDGDINYMNQISIPNLGVLSMDITQESISNVTINKLGL